MIIKDNAGDYGIVVGKWIGFRKGVKGDMGVLGLLLLLVL